MLVELDDIRKHLRQVHLFRELDKEDIDYIAEYFEAEEYEPDTELFAQGSRPEWFGIVYSGEVVVTARLDSGSKTPTELARLKTADYFGEQAIINNTVRNATITTTQQSVILIIEADDFRTMLTEYPDVLKALQLAVRTRQLIRQRRFGDWLRPDEVVFLIALTHWGWFVRRMLLPAALTLPVAIGVYFLFTINLFWLPATIVAGLLLGIWIALVYVDWRDDSYIVTSRRVVSDERLALLYKARAEAPLYAVRSVGVSQDPLEKALGYGDVVIQTFTGKINFPDVPDPYTIANLINEHIDRAKRSQQKEEASALERDIRVSIGWEEAPQGDARSRTRPPAAEAGSFLAFLNHFRPQFWERDGELITLRKHPFILLQHIGLGLAGLALVSLLFAFRLYPVFEFMRVLEIVPVMGWSAAVLFVGLILLAWTLYQFEDWRNDIYQITPNLLVDEEKKPLLGNVEQRTASIDSVLNVRFTRPGVLANLFNFGTVTIQTGGDTGELSFKWVVNPLSVQQEIFRRMEKRRRQKEAAQAAKRRSEIVDWLRAYAAVTQPEKPPDLQ